VQIKQYYRKLADILNATSHYELHTNYNVVIVPIFPIHQISPQRREARPPLY